MSFDGDAAKIITGPFDITINSTQLGHTEENVEELTHGDANTMHVSHESGEVPVKETRGPVPITLRAKAIEITKEVADELFPEAASVSVAGLVTVADKSITVLVPVVVRLHPSDTVGTANDHVYYNMVPYGPVIEGPLGRENKYMLNCSFRRNWADTDVAYTLGGFTNPTP